LRHAFAFPPEKALFREEKTGEKREKRAFGPQNKKHFDRDARCLHAGGLKPAPVTLKFQRLTSVIHSINGKDIKTLPRIKIRNTIHWHKKGICPNNRAAEYVGLI
jgi:hypothetical protein